MDKKMDFANGLKPSDIISRSQPGMQLGLRLAKWLLLGLPLLSSPQAFAGPIWQGNTDTDWATGTNWDTGNAPAAGEIADFSSAPINQRQPVIDALTTTAFAGINFNNGGIAPFSLTNDGDLTLTSSGISNSSGLIQQIRNNNIMRLQAGDVAAGVEIINDGQLYFEGTANATNAKIINRSTNRLDISNLAANSIRIGSLSGVGYVNLGEKTLIVGGLGLDDTISGIIYDTNDNGKLIKEGSGTLNLLDDNSFNGGVTVNGGTLQIGNGGSYGNLPSDIRLNNGSTLVFNEGGFLTYANALSDDGSNVNVIIRGGGRVTFSGDNTAYRGLTHVEEGNLWLNGNQLVGDIVNDDLVTFWNGEQTYSGNISGSGDVHIRPNNTEFFTLTGNITTTGITKIQLFAGYMQIGDGGTDGSVSGDIDVDSGARLYFNRSDDYLYEGTISSAGSGQVFQIGDGKVTFTADHTYISTTFIEAGSLQLGDGGTTGSVQGSIANNGVLIFNHSDDVVFNDNIAGTGSLIKEGAGKLTFTGFADYLGKTYVNAGTLQIGEGGTTGRLLSGSIENNGTVIFDRGDNDNYSGVISGSGNVIKQGAGLLNFNGEAQQYTGGTTISEGTLYLSGFSNLKGDILNNGTLYIAKFVPMTLASNISGTGNLVLDGGVNVVTLTGENTFSGHTTNLTNILRIGDGGTNGSIVTDIDNEFVVEFNRSDDYTYAGVISGLGRVEQIGSGKLTLLGDSTTTNSLVIRNGSVQLGDGGTSGFYQGSIVNRTSLIINRSDDVVYQGNISGEGSFTKEGAGTLTVLGNLTPQAGTVINEGGLRIGNGGNLGSLGGNVENNGTLIFDRDDNLNYSDSISGSGDVIKRGQGQLQLLANSSYTGTTIIEEGRLLINQVDNVSDFVNNAELLFDSRVNQTYTGDISGTGSLSIVNFGGKVTLTGELTHTGGTFLRGGQLQIGDGGTSGSLSGDLLANSLVYFDRSDDLVYDGNISSQLGWPGVRKYGVGTLSMNGISSYIGETQVHQGTLLVGGTAANSSAHIDSRTTTVFPGATLGGHGSLGGNLINNGTVSPGASIGTLTVEGDYIQAPNANFVVEVNSNGEGDLLNVLGTATVGGNLVIDTTAGFLPGHNYQIIQAAGGLAGEFTNVDGLGQFAQNFLSGEVTFDTENNQILLQTAFNETAFDDADLSRNQRIMANYLLASGGDPASQALVGSATTVSELQPTLDKLSGATYANQELQLAQTSRWFETQIANRMVLYPDCQREGGTSNKNCLGHKTVWVTVSGSNASIENESNSISGLDTDMGGVAAGIEFPIKHSGKIGAAVSAIYFSGDATGVESASDDGGLYQFGLYTHFHHGNWDLGANFDVGGTDSLDTTRTVGDYSNTSSYSASVIAQQFRIGYDILAKQGVHVRPYVGMLNQNVSRDSFTESGAGATLSVDEADFNSTKSVLGSAVEIPLGKLTFLGSLDWLHEFRDTNATVSGSLTNSTGTESFNDVNGISIGRDSARVQAGVKFAETGKLRFTALYVGDFAGSYSENGATLQIDFDLS